MAKAAAQHHIVDTVQTVVSEGIFSRKHEISYAPVTDNALKSLHSEDVHKGYYEFLVDDVPLNAFNGFRDIVYSGEWKAHRKPTQFSFFSPNSDRLIHYLAFPTLGGLFSCLGYDGSSNLRLNGICVSKQSGQVVLGALITEQNDLVHSRQLLGQSWDGVSPIFTRSSPSVNNSTADFYSTWTPSLLRTSTECDTSFSGVFSNHVKNRVGAVTSDDFTLNTITLSWTSRTAFNTSPATPGYVDVRIPAVLYRDESMRETISTEVRRRDSLSTEDKH